MPRVGYLGVMRAVDTNHGSYNMLMHKPCQYVDVTQAVVRVYNIGYNCGETGRGRGEPQITNPRIRESWGGMALWAVLTWQ